MARTKRPKNSAFTIVELMIVVMIIGVIAAVAIPMLGRYVKKSRTSEQGNLLNKLWAGSLVYYNADHVDSNNITVPKQFPGDITGDTGQEEPPDCGCMTGSKCPPWPRTGTPQKDLNILYSGLKYSVPDPHNYRAIYSATGSGTGAIFTATAFGDLDCDSVYGQFIRSGKVDSGEVTGQAAPYVVNELE